MTEQSSEILKVGDETLYISEIQPLEFYPGKDVSAYEYWNLAYIATSEHRRYCGTWTIKNNSLYLTSIFAYRRKVNGLWFWKKVSFQEMTVTDLFPHAINDEIKATWFTGRFSAYTKTTSNPVDDRLDVIFDKGDLVHHQWFHLEGSGKRSATPYNKPWP